MRLVKHLDDLVAGIEASEASYDKRVATPPISPSPDITLQPKPLRIDEIKPPFLDRDWDLKDIKPKPKRRPLPPIPTLHVRPMPRHHEATYNKGVAQYSPAKKSLAQPPIDIRRHKQASLLLGMFGEPVLSCSSTSSPSTQASSAIHTLSPPTPLLNVKTLSKLADDDFEELLEDIKDYGNCTSYPYVHLPFLSAHPGTVIGCAY